MGELPPPTGPRQRSPIKQRKIPNALLDDIIVAMFLFAVVLILIGVWAM